MTGAKLYGAAAVLGWFGVVGGPAAQIAIGPETLMPIGVAFGFFPAAVGAAWKVRGYIDRLEARIKALEDAGGGEQ